MNFYIYFSVRVIVESSFVFSNNLEHPTFHTLSGAKFGTPQTSQDNLTFISLTNIDYNIFSMSNLSIKFSAHEK